MNAEQKLQQAVKLIGKDWNKFLVDFESIICDDGHGVICMICYWHSDKYSVKKQDFDHDKFDYCKDHIIKKHTMNEIQEYLDSGA